MLTHKAIACWPIVLTLLPLGLGCADGLYSRPNTLPRRTVYPAQANGGQSNAALAAANTRPTSSAWDSLPKAQSTAQLPVPDPIPTAPKPVAASEAPIQPHQETSQPAPIQTVAMQAPQDPRPAITPAADPVQASAKNTNGGTTAASRGPLVAEMPARPAGKVPAPPENDMDPPPMPRRVTANLEDPSAPPPIPSVVKPAPTPTPGPGQAFSNPNDTLPQLRSVHKNAVDRFKTIDSYIARFRRREQINGKDKPEELMLFKFRKKPWSVYFKWLGIEGHNRECVYVKGQHSSLIHTILAEGDVMFLPAGKRFSVSPESALVRAKSRHAITEAGIGDLIDKFGMILDTLERGDKRFGTMKYLGFLRRPEFEKPHVAVEQVIPPGAETQLPKGGSRLWLFDPDNGLPVLLVTYDDTNKEVEYYCYDRIMFSKLDDDDFNPDKLWPKR
jgi:hypothetical protein